MCANFSKWRIIWRWLQNSLMYLLKLKWVSSQRQLKLPSSGISHHLVRVWRDVSEDNITSIFRAKHQPSKNAAYSSLLVPIHLLHVEFLFGWFRPWRRRGYVPPKCVFTCRLYAVSSQKMRWQHSVQLYLELHSIWWWRYALLLFIIFKFKSWASQNNITNKTSGILRLICL
jgi:hypothetical protein